MSPLRMVVQFFLSKQPVSMRAMFLVASVGMLVGLLVGYVMMGSIHAFLEMGVDQHYGFATKNAKAIRATTVASASHVNHPDAVDAVAELASAGLLDADRGTQRIDADTTLWPSTGNRVHTICTSNGSPYTNFQNRIMYATYKLAQQEPGGEVLSAFTRILHRSSLDELMMEIPTFHAQPQTPACDNWCPFPVADRPNAVRQFFEAAAKDPSLIQAPWILLIETDYVWMRPLQQVPTAESASKSWAFQYGYIMPTYPSIEGVMRTMYPESMGPLSNVPGTGPAPIMMRATEWVRVVPEWERLTAHIESNEEAKGKLGWVREMYAFSIAAAIEEVKFDLRAPPVSPLMVQPPADSMLGEAALCHYTWGSIFKDTLQNDKEVWKFDKRFYTAKADALKVPQLEEPIEWRPGLKVIGRSATGDPVTPELVDLLRMMVRRMNNASSTLLVNSPCPLGGCIFRNI